MNNLLRDTSSSKWGQVILRHTELSAYRCFLPDLAGFTGFCCTGPGPLKTLKAPIRPQQSRYSDNERAAHTKCGMAERVGIRSRARPTARAPTEGASPLVCSPRGGHVHRDPPVRIPPSARCETQSSALIAQHCF